MTFKLFLSLFFNCWRKWACFYSPRFWWTRIPGKKLCLWKSIGCLELQGCGAVGLQIRCPQICRPIAVYLPPNKSSLAHLYVRPNILINSFKNKQNRNCFPPTKGWECYQKALRPIAEISPPAVNLLSGLSNNVFLKKIPWFVIFFALLLENLCESASTLEDRIWGNVNVFSHHGHSYLALRLNYLSFLIKVGAEFLHWQLYRWQLNPNTLKHTTALLHNHT